MIAFNKEGETPLDDILSLHEAERKGYELLHKFMFP